MVAHIQTTKILGRTIEIRITCSVSCPGPIYRHIQIIYSFPPCIWLFPLRSRSFGMGTLINSYLWSLNSQSQAGIALSSNLNKSWRMGQVLDRSHQSGTIAYRVLLILLTLVDAGQTLRMGSQVVLIPTAFVDRATGDWSTPVGGGSLIPSCT